MKYISLILFGIWVTVELLSVKSQPSQRITSPPVAGLMQTFR